MNNVILFIKKFKTILILAGIAMLVVRCSSTKSATSTVSVNEFEPVQSDVAIAQAQWKTTTYSDLTQGYGLYASKCTQCHDMKKLDAFSEADWPGIMQSMGRKAKLDSTQYNLVYHYILTRRQAIVSTKK
jgi:nitrate/TMAO reductase-like tetraheme cytochrome c subunit